MFKKILKVLLIVLALVGLLVAVLLFKTITFKSKQLDIAATPAPELEPRAIEHFQGAIRYKTISNADPSLFDSSQFNGFHRYLRATYPLVHQKLSVQKLVDYTLLYRWEGSD